jgi:hypothetical protein
VLLRAGVRARRGTGVFPVQVVARDGAQLTLTLPLTDAWSPGAADLFAA